MIFHLRAGLVRCPQESSSEYQRVRCSTILGPAVFNTSRAEGLYMAVFFYLNVSVSLRNVQRT